MPKNRHDPALEPHRATDRHKRSRLAIAVIVSARENHVRVGKFLLRLPAVPPCVRFVRSVVDRVTAKSMQIDRR
jgi:hypothetical protein